MQTFGELVGAGLVALMFYSLTNIGVKNSGSLDLGTDGPQPVADPLNPEADHLYAQADGIKSRDPNDLCQVKPPEMLSTSLLPAKNDALEDDDFLMITPDKLQSINFLNAGWALGRDTTTNTMKNVSYDLRSELPNPRILTVDNNSFANTTIDFQPRRSFEPELPSGELNNNLGSAH